MGYQPRRTFSSKIKEEERSSLVNSVKANIKLGKEGRRQFADFMELTKFKLSLLNSIGSFTMFYFHAPLAGVGLLNASLFLFAT